MQNSSDAVAEVRKLILLSFILVANCTWAQVFGPELPVSLGSPHTYQPTRCRAADFTGDGLADVVIATTTTPINLVWYENLGAGHFGPQNFLIADSGYKDIEANDIDLDGDIDIIGVSDGTLMIFFNDGTGIFAPVNVAGSGSFTPSLFCLSDIDGDVDQDIVVDHSSSIYWYKNLGGGIFSTKILITSGFSTITALATGDPDGNGTNDIFIGTNLSPARIEWCQNLGGGSFGPHVVMEYILNPYSIISSDIDYDSDEDLILVAASKLKWKENTGSGVFNPSADLEILYSGTTSLDNLAVIDMDGDNVDDLVVLNSGWNRIIWKKNLGGGTFAAADTVLLIEDGLFAEVRDINSDGLPEVISGNDYFGDETGNSLVFSENLGAGNFGKIEYINDMTRYPKRVHTADLDGDGYVDILSASQGDDKIAWYKNLQGNEFGHQQVISKNFESADMVFSIDLDGDSDMDVVAGRTESIYVGQLVWFQNTSGNFGNAIPIDNNVGGINDIHCMDFDIDGDNDILISADADFEKGGWYENLGGGTFSSFHMIIDPAVPLHCIYASDLDADGDNDIMLSTSVNTGWMENLGGMTFGPYQEILYGMSRDIKSGDMDNDGDIDIVIARYEQVGPYSIVCWAKNDGNANFTTLIISQSTTVAPQAIELADFNDDGMLDVVVNLKQWMSSGSPKTLLYLNLGGTAFSTGELITTHNKIPYALGSADFDNDGDIDLVTGTFEEHKIIWHDNYTYFNTNLSGRVFFDIDQNTNNDITDPGIYGLSVISDPMSDYTFTDSSGFYEYQFSDAFGIYQFYLDSVPHWSIVTDSLSYMIISNQNMTNVDSLDFGIYPDSVVYEVKPDLTALNSQCNTTGTYWITVSNSGTTLASGIFWLMLSPEVTFLSSNISPDSVSGGTLYWHYDSLFYFADYQVIVEASIPDFTFTGDIFTHVLGTTVVDSLGNVAYTAADTTMQIHACAYDPNDKSVEPTGVDVLGYIPPTTPDLEYLIRFQNTGTDTAQTVVVKDQLDANLDWNSLDLIASSQAMQVMVDQSGEVSFVFENINLPDSNTNFLGSQGFVKFSIDILPGLPLGTQIENTAGIYFDYNPAVITNTVVNTIFDCQQMLGNLLLNANAICETETFVGLIPDSTTNTVYTWELTGIDTITDNQFNWITDQSGNFELHVKVSNVYCTSDSTINLVVGEEVVVYLPAESICDGDSVEIFGTYQESGGIYYSNLQTTIGCDSMVVKELLVLPVYSMSLGSSTICNQDSLYFFNQYHTLPGIYSDTLQAQSGCDSVLLFQLIVAPPLIPTNLGVSEICTGDSLMVFGNYSSNAGIYSDTLSNIFGCDSVLIQQVNVFSPTAVNIDTLADTLVCLSQGLIVLSATPTGGTFTGTGVTANQFDPAASGTGIHSLYYHYTDVNGCSATDSSTISVNDCLGQPENNSMDFSIYPNPFSDYTTIYFGQELSGNYSILIYDVLGQIVYSNEHVNGSQIEIHRNELKAGAYIISMVESGNLLEVYSDKLIIE